MLPVTRTFLLILVPLLVAFPAFADNGIAALGDTFKQLLLFAGWLLGSAVLLTIGLLAYARKKIAAAAFLTYFAFASLTILYLRFFNHFWEIRGDLISDNTIDTPERDDVLASYRILIVAGFVLLGAVVAFGVYHWKSLKRKRRWGE